MARAVLAKYGALIAEYRHHGRQGQILSVRLVVNLVGRFRPATLARYLRAVATVVMPDRVDCRVARRGAGVRPALSLGWYGPAAQRLLDAVGWQVGRPAFDRKADAWRRWLAYRRATWAHWPDAGVMHVIRDRD
jgi:hypothetical protein